LNSNMELSYKISIAILVFTIMLLISFASQALNVKTQHKTL